MVRCYDVIIPLRSNDEHITNLKARSDDVIITKSGLLTQRSAAHHILESLRISLFITFLVMVPVSTGTMAARITSSYSFGSKSRVPNCKMIDFTTFPRCKLNFYVLTISDCTVLDMYVHFVLCYFSTIQSAAIESFGVTTSSDSWASTAGTVIISLWYEETVYECSYSGMSENTEYSCTSTSWSVSTDACDDGTGYKLMIDNSGSADGLGIDSAFLQLGDANYTIEAWCVSNSTSVGEDAWMSEYLSTACPSGYNSYDVECFGNETTDCVKSTLSEM